MNAAEITDKLGLHSLRQRAWVCFLGLICRFIELYTNQSFFQTVHPVHLRYLRWWSLRGSRVARQHPPKGGPPVDCWLRSLLERTRLLSILLSCQNTVTWLLFQLEVSVVICKVIGQPIEVNPWNSCLRLCYYLQPFFRFLFLYLYIVSCRPEKQNARRLFSFCQPTFSRTTEEILLVSCIGSTIERWWEASIFGGTWDIYLYSCWWVSHVVPKRMHPHTSNLGVHGWKAEGTAAIQWFVLVMGLLQRGTVHARVSTERGGEAMMLCPWDRMLFTSPKKHYSAIKDWTHNNVLRYSGANT